MKAKPRLINAEAALPSDDEARFDLIRSYLYTAVVGDCLDSLGFTHQFLPPEIRGLGADQSLVGRAMPVLIADAFGPPKQPFGLLTAAVDQLQPGEVYVAHGGHRPTAAWGEILTAAAKSRQAAGAVIDGYHRDTKRVAEQDWPVFSRGSYAQDALVRTSVIDYRCTVEIGNVSVSPGDLVLGDVDGVLIVPMAVEDEVLHRALIKSQGENEVREAIELGMSATEAFAHFGIL